MLQSQQQFDVFFPGFAFFSFVRAFDLGGHTNMRLRGDPF
jgi:hypothetical protein